MPKGKMYNKGNGPEAKQADSKRKYATEGMKGRHNQPKGSSKHNTKPRKAKPMPNPHSGMEDYEF